MIFLKSNKIDKFLTVWLDLFLGQKWELCFKTQDKQEYLMPHRTSLRMNRKFRLGKPDVQNQETLEAPELSAPGRVSLSTALPNPVPAGLARENSGIMGQSNWSLSQHLPPLEWVIPMCLKLLLHAEKDGNLTNLHSLKQA